MLNVLAVLKKKPKDPGPEQRKPAFVAPPVLGRGLQGWCAVAGGMTIETMSSLWDLKPPPAETLASLGDELDRTMRSHVFLHFMKYGVGLISTPACVKVTNTVTRAQELARRGVFRWRR